MCESVKTINLSAIGMKMQILGKDLRWLAERMKLDPVVLGNRILMQNLSSADVNAISVNLQLPLKEIYGKGNTYSVGEVISAFANEYINPRFDALESKLSVAGEAPVPVIAEKAVPDYPVVGKSAVTITDHWLYVKFPAETAKKMKVYPDFQKDIIPAITKINFHSGCISFCVNENITRQNGCSKIYFSTKSDAIFKYKINPGKERANEAKATVYLVGDGKYQVTYEVGKEEP